MNYREIKDTLIDNTKIILNKKEIAEFVDRARNELCNKCGNYRESHLGACDDCIFR